MKPFLSHLDVGVGYPMAYQAILTKMHIHLHGEHLWYKVHTEIQIGMIVQAQHVLKDLNVFHFSMHSVNNNKTQTIQY